MTQSPDTIHKMPTKLRWFLDPHKVIKKYASCKVNPKKCGLQSLSLGSVWSHLNDGATLEGAHDSLVDARTQSDVLFHPHLVSFVDRKKSIVTIDEVFGKNQIRELKKELEPNMIKYMDRAVS